MTKLSEISKRREQNPQVKAAELENRVFTVWDCIGPFEAKKKGNFENRPFLVFVVSLVDPTPEEIEVGNTFDLLMSHIAGYRDDLYKHFSDPDAAPNEGIGPLTMVKTDVGQPQPMWEMVDWPIEPSAEPEPAGNGRKAKAKAD